MAELLPSDTRAQCLNCGYSLRGLEEPRCPECGRAFDPEDPNTMWMGTPLIPLRSLVNPVGTLTTLIAGAIAAAMLISVSAPGACFGLLLLTCFAWLVFWLAWGVRLLCWCFFYPKWDPKKGLARRRWLVAPAIFLITLLLIWVRAPLYVSFWISRPAMGGLAQEAFRSVGGTLPDRRVGLYVAHDIERFPAGVRFWVGHSGYGFADWHGFAYCPWGPPSSTQDHRYEHFRGKWYLYTRVF